MTGYSPLWLIAERSSDDEERVANSTHHYSDSGVRDCPCDVCPSRRGCVDACRAWEVWMRGRRGNEALPGSWSPAQMGAR